MPSIQSISLTSPLRRRVAFASLLALTAIASPALATAPPNELSSVRALEQQRLLDSHASQLRSQRPEWAQKVDSAPVYASRTGSMVFYGPDIADPQAATLLVDRANHHPDPAFRRAVAEALPSTRAASLGALIASQLPLEPDAGVREALTHALRYGQDAPTADALRWAAQDENARVRTIALRSMRAHPQLASFASQILSALQDRDPSVQEAALKAWGTLRNRELAVDIQVFLRSDHEQVRLAALRAQGRVDVAAARRWAQDLGLARDPSTKVARLAQRLLR